MVALIFSALSVLSQLPLPNTILPFLQAALKPFRPFPLHSCTFCKNISRFNPSFKSPRRINIRDSSSFLFLSFFSIHDSFVLFHSRFFRSISRIRFSRFVGRDIRTTSKNRVGRKWKIRALLPLAPRGTETE